MSKKQITTHVLLTTFALVFSLAFWYLWQQLLLSPLALFSALSQNLISVTLLALSAIGVLAGVSLVALLIEHRITKFIGLFLISVAPLISLINKPTAAISVLTLTLTLSYFAWQVNREIQNHIRFNVGHIFDRRLGFLVTVLSALMGLQFFTASQPVAENFEFSVPDSIFQQALQIVRPMLQEQIETQVQGVQDRAGRQEYQGALLRGEIPAELEAQLRQQGISEAELQNFEQQLQQAIQEGQLDLKGLEGQVTQTFLSQFKTELETQINQIIAPYRKYLPAVLGFLIFLTVKSLGGLIAIGAIAAIALGIKFLLLTNLAIKESKTVEAERLRINI